MKSNFEFLKEIDTEIYSEVVAIEKSAITDRRGFGNKMRQLLEKLCNKRIKKFGIYNTMLSLSGRDNVDLAFKLNALTVKKTPSGEKYMDIFKREAPGIKPMPDFELWRYDEMDENAWRFFNKSAEGKEKYRFASNFLRQFGNDCSHDYGMIDPVFDVTYEQILDALKTFHRYLREYFEVQNVPQFKEINVPIGEKYEVLEMHVPADRDRSGCEQEYRAHYYSGARVTTPQHAIIRRYRKNADNADDGGVSEEEFFARSLVALSQGQGIDGNVRVEEVVSYLNPDTEFYMIAYIFNEKPLTLSNERLKEMDYGARLKLCYETAELLSNYHKKGIYHRMLSAKSIYIVPDGNGFKPSVINFSFAKVIDQNTVFIRAEQALEKEMGLREQKYLAPEWAKPDEETDWAKVDIYSLGMLFMDVLSGEILARPDFAKIKDERIIDLLKSMLRSRSDDRSDIEEVITTVKELL